MNPVSTTAEGGNTLVNVGEVMTQFANSAIQGISDSIVAMRGDVQREFQEHAAEEYNHAKLLADRIIELEGVPVLDPKQWFDLARCKYDAPVDFGSEILLKQNVESERCAIYRYQQIAEFTNGIDFTTCDIAKHIMAEEEDHEQDLQDYLNDIARMKAYILKK